MKLIYNWPIRILIFVGIAILIWIVGIMIGQENALTILSPDNWLNVQKSAGQPQVTFLIDSNDGQMKTFEYQLDGKTNLISAITSALAAKNIKNEAKYNGEKLETLNITDKLDNVDGMRWHFWVNNVYQQRDPASVVLKNGDVIYLKYFKYQP